MPSYIFPNFNPTVDGKDGEDRSVHIGSFSLIFPNMDATLSGKDGQDRGLSGSSMAKVIYPISNMSIRSTLGIKNVSGKLNMDDDLRDVIAGWVCILGGSEPVTTTDFPNMDATTGGKDGGDITQNQAETQSTYTDNNWDFINVWYMGSKYPLLL